MTDDGMQVFAFDLTAVELHEACGPVAEQLAALSLLLEATAEVDVELPPAIALHVSDATATLPDRELRELSLHALLNAIACRAAADAQVPF